MSDRTRVGASVGRLRQAMDAVYREMIKFGAVGAVAFVVDVGLFNLLTTALWPGADPAPLDGHEKLAKVVSAGIATVVAWLGNRYWTFRHRRQASRPREFATFALMNLVALAIAVLCLAFSHDVLGFTSTFADNVAGSVVGVGLGTLFRFWAYRRFVFVSPEVPAGSVDLAAAGGDAGQDAVRPVDLVSDLSAELDRLQALAREVTVPRAD